MKIRKFLLIILTMLLGSCDFANFIKVNQGLLKEKDDAVVPSVPSLYNFSTLAVTESDIIGGQSKIITLAYTEPQSTKAEICELQSLDKVTITSGCVCDVAGVCSLTLKGSVGGLGQAALEYRVGKGSDFSIWKTIQFNINCPSGYVSVPHNSSVNVANDFCVMKFEAKNVAGVATSQATSLPWHSIDQVASKAACLALNATNGVTDKYDLISNPEWMNIARNIEVESVNWHSNLIDVSSTLSRGHTDSNPYTSLAVTDESDPYNGTGNNSSEPSSVGWEQKRTLQLSNGNVIWDFAGNVWEWTDFSMSPGLQFVTPALKPYHSADGGPVGAYRELFQIDTLIGENPSDLFSLASFKPIHTMFDHSQAYGQYFADGTSSGGSMLRGGAYFEGNYSGIYAFGVDQESNGGGDWAGFRCVFRP